LSVGNVAGDGATGGDDTAASEADRGLIKQLNDEDILEILKDTGDRKFSIGSETEAGKTSFANKQVKEKGNKKETTGLGYTCRKGLKPESPNQDSFSVLQVQDHWIYGVYDGHGKDGHDVSNFVKDNMPKLIIRDQRFRGNDMGQMMLETFKRMQTLIATQDRSKKLSAQMAGTTATVVIHDSIANKLLISHVADSTCVLGSYKNGKPEGVALTRDHKPDLPDEKARITKAGGRVVFDGYANHRVYAKNGRYPGLNMSRCLGDLLGHQDAGCSAEPEVSERQLGKDDFVLLLCSDGVWEFITPTEAVTIVEKKKSNPSEAADVLAKEAWDRWIREEGGAVVDDITVVVKFLSQSDSNAPSGQ
jgi:serine/threonine protein phosphatase PrpC